MILLTLLACLPPTFAVEADVYDIDRACIYRDVNVTFDTTYWSEWYLDKGDCLENSVSLPTRDGLCISYETCTDHEPLISDDPLFDLSNGAVEFCREVYEGHPTYPNCESPVLTEWP